MIFKPPMNIAKRNFGNTSIFLAGSIENGNAEDWQKDLGDSFRLNHIMYSTQGETIGTQLGNNHMKPIVFSTSSMGVECVENMPKYYHEFYSSHYITNFFD